MSRFSLSVYVLSLYVLSLYVSIFALMCNLSITVLNQEPLEGVGPQNSPVNTDTSL